MSTSAHRFILASFLTTALAVSLPAASAQRQETFHFNGWSLDRVTLPADTGPAVSYYLSKPKAKAPLVLFVQGSGCTPPFSGLGTQERSASILPWVPLAQSGRYAVMSVDKPYQPAQQDGQGGSSSGCGDAFNQEFSYDAWLATLRAALRHALARPEIDATRVLVVGISEGGVMAAGLARAVPAVGAVALAGVSGTTQLFDSIARIHQGGGSDEDKLRELASLEATLKDIQANPGSGSKLAWGHPYRRWSSFLAQSPGDNLLQSKARVYIVSGMRDASVPILSTEVMYAQLRAQGRDVTMRRLPGANHDLVTEGGGADQVMGEYGAIMRWFDAS